MSLWREYDGNLTTNIRPKWLVCRRCIAILVVGFGSEVLQTDSEVPLQERVSTDKITRSRDAGQRSESSKIRAFAGEQSPSFWKCQLGFIVMVSKRRHVQVHARN